MADKPAKQERNRDKKGRFVKGVSGNPNGRPTKANCISDQLRALLEQEAPNMGGKTYAEVLALAMMREALGGNAPYMKELMDRIEGKVQAPKGGGPDDGTLSKVDQIFQELGYGSKPQ